MNAKTSNRICWFLSGCLIILMVALWSDVFASDRDDINTEADANAEAKAKAEAQADANAYGGNAEGGQGGNASTRIFAAGASSGDSTSICQKVRDLRFADAFLFGIRWDVTDKECQRLALADRHYALGNTYFADTLTCSTPFVLETFGDVNECKTALEKNDVVSALKARIEKLETDKKALAEERSYDRIECEKSKDRLQDTNEKLEERCTK